MKKAFKKELSGLVSVLLLLAMCGLTAQAQLITITNYTFDSPASASPPAWGVWPNGIAQYITNAWNSSDASNNPSSGSLLITSTFSGASQQSVVWSGQAGDYNPPLTGSLISNFSCWIRFDPSSPVNTTNNNYGSLAFYLNTLQHGAYPPTQIGTYSSVAAGNTNWVQFSFPVSLSSGTSVYGITIQLETYGNSLSGTSKMYVDDVQLTGSSPVVVTNSTNSGSATADWNNVHQRIDGFGASSAWNPTWSTAEADLLFSTNNNISYQGATFNGVGLSLLRNHIVFGSNTAASTVLTTVETNIMLLAQARGARVWSAPWTPAAGFKSTNDIYDTNVATAGGINGGSYLGNGNNATNVSYASQLANYVASMKNTYGINLYALSLQNEPDAQVTSYEACQWTGTQVHDFVPNLSAALSAKGFGSLKIIVPESEDWSGDTALWMPTLNDPNTAAMVSIVANHDYVEDNGVGDQSVPAALNVNGKARWETEVALLSGSDSSIANGVYYAQRIYEFMTQANVNAYHYWWLVSGAAGNEGLLDSSAAVTKRLFTFGQYSRFVRPNYNRIDATSSDSTLLVSAYKDSASTSFAIVAVNTNPNTDMIETFSLTNFTAGTVTPWMTSVSNNLAQMAAVSLVNGSFTYLVPAMSVVTFVGRGNTPPTIAAVATQTVNAGVTLTLTNTANDSDLPAQTLTFSAANTFPTGASINSSNGVFKWRPLVSQANTTSTIQVQVTDNGTPNLSATNSFLVKVNPIVNPTLGSVTISGAQVHVTVSGSQGPDYTLLTSTNLTNWSVLYTTNSPTPPFMLTDTNAADPERFYKVQIGP
jgi:glucuronoarabinoxylan endo-1,4-beta-xylanase